MRYHLDLLNKEVSDLDEFLVQDLDDIRIQATCYVKES